MALIRSTDKQVWLKWWTPDAPIKASKACSTPWYPFAQSNKSIERVVPIFKIYYRAPWTCLWKTITLHLLSNYTGSHAAVVFDWPLTACLWHRAPMCIVVQFLSCMTLRNTHTRKSVFASLLELRIIYNHFWTTTLTVESDHLTCSTLEFLQNSGTLA